MAVLMSKLHSICQLNKVQAKQLASVVGSIISMSLAVGLVSQFMTHCLCTVLETRRSWWDSLDITEDACQELEFRKACLTDFDCQPIWHFPILLSIYNIWVTPLGLGLPSKKL